MEKHFWDSFARQTTHEEPLGGNLMKIGYVRVSTSEQKTERQETTLQDLGVEKIFIDKASGKTANRPELNRMMDYVRDGDAVIVESISRFARSARDFLDLIERLSEKEVAFISKKEAIDTATPAGKFMLTVFAAVAELEREYIRDRQREGIEIARKSGKYRGRRPRAYPGFERLLAQSRLGEITAASAMRKLGMSKTTWYRKVRETMSDEPSCSQSEVAC
jgi:DNA invertase Pin-like site-specific DNA recombinase